MSTICDKIFDIRGIMILIAIVTDYMDAWIFYESLALS